MQDVSIRLSVLQKLPKPCTVLGIEQALNMNREEKVCLVVSWVEQHPATAHSRGFSEHRVGLFDLETGDYVGEK